jgi:hypothetical protein
MYKLDVAVGTTGLGLREWVASYGRPDMLSETGVVHPFSDCTVTSKVTD